VNVGIDLEHLRRHYSSLSDEGLRTINPDDLVEAARQCYEEEVARRAPASGRSDAAAAVLKRSGREATYRLSGDGEEAWLEDAHCVCAFTDHPGGHAAEDADEARQALETAGIACAVSREEGEGERARPEYRVMVPAGQELHAMSVLDCEVFNPKVEAEWRGMFELMSDEDLAALNAEVLCAGLLDRAERLRIAYEEELHRRGLNE
jgi:hypothetical protein